MSEDQTYEIIALCITNRAAEQLRKVAAETGRTIENLAESAVEDACIQSERGR